MDELSALPPEGAIHRLRTSSLQHRSFASHSPSSARTASPCRHNPDRPEILAPVPRRLETCTNQPWMRPASPSSPLTPVSAPGPSPSRARRISASSTRPRQLSFSSLHGQDRSGINAATTGVQWAPGITSPSALGSPGRKLRKVVSKTELRSSGEKAMGRRWIRWMQKRGMEDWVLPGALMTSVLIKWCIGLGSYSGEHLVDVFCCDTALTRDYGRNGNATFVWGL